MMAVSSLLLEKQPLKSLLVILIKQKEYWKHFCDSAPMEMLCTPVQNGRREEPGARQLRSSVTAQGENKN